MWCVPELDVEYIKRMEDVLELYERPYDENAPVVCLDERPTPLHGETRKSLPAKPGRPARYDYEYVRNGTANVFCAVEPLAGKHITRATKNRNHREFAKMMNVVDRRYPNAGTIHLVIDNLSTHSVHSLTRFYGEEKGQRLWTRFTIHYTPKHGSWLNMAEIEIGLLNRQGLGNHRFPDLPSLLDRVRDWNRRVNKLRQKITWTFTRKKARKTSAYKPTKSKRSQH